MLHLRRAPRREATFLFEERGESPRLELGHAPLVLGQQCRTAT
jgi:hypothetical protein